MAFSTLSGSATHWPEYLAYNLETDAVRNFAIDVLDPWPPILFCPNLYLWINCLFALKHQKEERMQDIKNAAVPYNTVGLLDVLWVPLAGPNDDDAGKPIREIYADEVPTNYCVCDVS